MIRHFLRPAIAAFTLSIVFPAAAEDAASGAGTSPEWPDRGDRIDHRLDHRGDAIDARLDRKGDRIDDRLNR